MNFVLSVLILVVSMSATIVCMHQNSVLSQMRTYPKNEQCSGGTVLTCAQNLHTQMGASAATAGFTDYQKTLLRSLHGDGVKDPIQVAQIAAPLFHEILTNAFPWCLNAHVDRREYASLKGVYTTIWTGLGESGWFLWSEECLAALQNISKTKRLLYPAGGTDITALLSRGIYNIDIIDPLPATQARYYADKYQWLTGIDSTAVVGDTFTEQFVTQKLTFTRIQNSTTPPCCVWQICDPAQNKLGTLSFSRRGLEQHDFFTSAQIVISYNELIFLCLPEALGGWDIDIKNFPAARAIYVKQLGWPLTMDMLLNLRILLSMSLLDFRFISLGNDIT